MNKPIYTFFHILLKEASRFGRGDKRVSSSKSERSCECVSYLRSERGGVRISSSRSERDSERISSSRSRISNKSISSSISIRGDVIAAFFQIKKEVKSSLVSSRLRRRRCIHHLFWIWKKRWHSMSLPYIGEATSSPLSSDVGSGKR